MRKGYLIALLVTITLFSTVKYIQVVGEKQRLWRSVDQIGKRLSVLERQKHVLIQQIGDKSPVLEGNRESLIREISRINDKLIRAKDTIVQLQLGMTALKKERKALLKRAEGLRNEKVSLEARLKSLRELKRAAREIKKEMRLVRRQMQERIDMVATMGGNRGYLTRDGKSTFKKKVKIKVIPIEAGN